MKLMIAGLMLLVILQSCHCAPTGFEDYEPDESMPSPGKESYDIHENNYNLGGHFGIGLGARAKVGVDKTGLGGTLDGNIGTDWALNAGSRSTHRRIDRPVYPRFDDGYYNRADRYPPYWY